MSTEGTTRYRNLDVPCELDVLFSFLGKEVVGCGPGTESNGFVYYSYPGNHRVLFSHGEPIAIYDGATVLIERRDSGISRFLFLYYSSSNRALDHYCHGFGITCHASTRERFDELYRQLSIQQHFFEDEHHGEQCCTVQR